MSETTFKGITRAEGRFTLMMTGEVTPKTLLAVVKQVELYAEFLGDDRAEGDGHTSDCATHNEPALPNGPCDCKPEAE